MYHRRNNDSFLEEGRCAFRDLSCVPMTVTTDAYVYIHRPDDKTARDFNIVAGSVLHLVLALRGGL